jgi:5-methylcytosine-specific restriction endonuclease McrA
VLERDGRACVYCGADKPLEGDHIVPLSRGGSNALTNLATACRPCNLSKGSSTLEEWRARRGRRRASYLQALKQANEPKPIEAQATSSEPK